MVLNERQKTTFLFDLDGTLLPIDLDHFLKRYFQSLSFEFSDLAEPDTFIKILLKSTQDMINNNGKRLNSEVFKESFFSLIEVDDVDAVMERFDNFYNEKFPLLGEGLKTDNTPAELIRLLKGKGYQLVIATNPVFPLEAVIERMRWLGLKPEDFALITHYENMHYCKPDPEYFQEILTKLGVTAGECVMVGNDMEEDMVAGELGIRTYLVEDFLIDRNTGSYSPSWRGSLLDLLSYFEDLV